MRKVSLHNIAQIDSIDVEFGDFTVIVGPQASGKSIFLQLVKLGLDSTNIKKTIKQYGYSWNSFNDLLDLYLGEGMHKIWHDSSSLILDGKIVSKSNILNSKSRKDDQVFYVPAQRVVTIQNGWPRNYMSFEALDPFVVKRFSEHLRILMEKGLGAGKKGSVFPQAGRMKSGLRTMINDAIFHNAKVELDNQSPKKRFLLSVGDTHLPYMAWSAGQREFMPLLLGLYWLMPASRKPRNEEVEYVVIEEPEMGLHPLAIQSLLLLFFELIYRGYKVVVSTHSPVILELCWVIRNIQSLDASEDYLFDLFDINKSQGVRSIFKEIVQNKKFKTYFFNRSNDQVTSLDISTLSPDSNSELAASWGGHLSFSDRSTQIVSKMYAEKL